MLTLNPEKKQKEQANDADVHVGRGIRRRRVRLDMTQAALGAAIGVSFQQIQKYEKGTNRVSASRLHELANALDVKPSYFFEGLPDENKSGEQVDAKDLDLPPGVVQFVTSEEGLEIVRALTPHWRPEDTQTRRYAYQVARRARLVSIKSGFHSP